MPDYRLSLKWYEYLKSKWKQAKTFLCRIKLIQMDYGKIEMKLVQLFSPPHICK